MATRATPGTRRCAMPQTAAISSGPQHRQQHHLARADAELHRADQLGRGHDEPRVTAASLSFPEAPEGQRP